jgi:hypothetical protein
MMPTTTISSIIVNPAASRRRQVGQGRCAVSVRQDGMATLHSPGAQRPGRCDCRCDPGRRDRPASDDGDERQNLLTPAYGRFE